jgi:hypothetical protein
MTDAGMALAAIGTALYIIVVLFVLLMVLYGIHIFLS